MGTTYIYYNYLNCSYNPFSLLFVNNDNIFCIFKSFLINRIPSLHYLFNLLSLVLWILCSYASGNLVAGIIN